MSSRVLGLAVIAGLLFALPARADGSAGGPLYLSAGMSGVTMPGAQARYITTSVGANTLLLRVRRHGGEITRYRTLHGRLSIPAVAIDGTAGGLSADGRLLVLFKPVNRFPVRRSRFALVDGRTLHVVRFSLRGAWGFDAVSPDGMSIYLTRYSDPSDPAHYALHRYDVPQHRVAPGAIVDRREPDEKMGGQPITRAISPSGRWAYTLYDGGGESAEPFIHALDTARGRSFCIDLDELETFPDLYKARLVRTGNDLHVAIQGVRYATVDTRTLHVVVRDSPWTIVW